MSDDTATLFQILVMPDFNMSATMAFVDPFRAANYLEGRGVFHWQFMSEGGGMVRASNGAALETTPLDTRTRPDFLIVAASWEPTAHASTRVQAMLRSAARAGVTLGALDTGAFVLAQAGLLEGHRATVHYEHIDAFQELYPAVDVSENLWVFDGARITCCGGAASTEFALHLVQSLQGPALANATARYVFAQALRDHTASQNPQDAEPLGATVPETVRRAVKVMEENLETPLSIAGICARVGISHRQLNRLFAQFVKKTPALYYRDIRLDRARGLITQTNLSMTEIAYASGFSSQVHFSRAYRQRFGMPPSRDRIEGRIPFEYRAWPMHQKSKPGDGKSKISGE